MSRDGVECSVNIDVTHHRTDASRANLNEIADRLRVSRVEIFDVLRDWHAEDARRHLEKFTADELKPPAFRAP